MRFNKVVHILFILYVVVLNVQNLQSALKDVNRFPQETRMKPTVSPQPMSVDAFQPIPVPVDFPEKRIEAEVSKVAQPRAVISAIKIPLDKVHNLAAYIQPSVKQGRLFDFNNLSSAQLKEMQQVARQVYQDDNTMRYIAERMGEDLQSVKISLYSLIGQLPHQIVQKESVEKREKENQMKGPRRWGP